MQTRLGQRQHLMGEAQLGRMKEDKTDCRARPPVGRRQTSSNMRSLFIEGVQKKRTTKHVDNNRSPLPIGHQSEKLKLTAKLSTSLPLILALVVILQTGASCTVADGEQRKEAHDQSIKPSGLPTVIVRGFLNYRTTVDGTVLLFTPDAGSSSSAASIQPTSAASQLQMQVTPTAVLQDAGSARQLLAESRVGPEADWRPLQSSSGRVAPSVLRPSASQTPMQMSIAPDWRPVASSEPAQEQPGASVKPSVQTDDVLSEPRARGVIRPEVEASAHKVVEQARATRPRRPSLGFSGQSSRGGASSSTTNQINGIRKPGLGSSTTGAPATEPASTSQVSSAFQARLASAKLRGRFRRPGYTNTSGPVQAAASSLDAVAVELEARLEDRADVGAAEGAAGLQARMGDALGPAVGSDEVSEVGVNSSKPEWRVGEQRSSGLLSGGLTGSLSSGELEQPLEGFGQAEQQPSELAVQHSAPAKAKKHNDKLNGWLDQHHNKFVARPSAAPPTGQLSSALAASLNQLAPSFAANLQQVAPVRPTPVLEAPLEAAEAPSSTAAPAASSVAANESAAVELQTLTRTYSTVLTTSKTRLVPLQVKSATAIHTVTEQYVITKLLTAYQTLPAHGEFLLADAGATRPPFELFNEPAEEPAKRADPPSPAAPGPPPAAPDQEQPIELEAAKSANDWLHELGSLEPGAELQQHQAQQALLETHQLLAGSEPLDQLASSNQLDPARLLAEGAINIPDLNNPLVLAAAIQNPQLAAVILAAQQLQLKQRAAGKAAPAGPAQVSLSTSLRTQVRPSTYTVRDTMYTTRLVSFRDGRTVRTRTVSEPGSVVEQVLTSLATEVTPVTLSVALRPSATLAALHSSAAPQTSLNNALLASQLAGLLARRQHQLQPSSAGGHLSQLAALQHLAAGRAGAAAAPPGAKAFQPNLQQLLASMQAPRAPAAPPAASARPAEAAPAQPAGPLTTTLTSVQVRTYTVHNAFKTIYRTISSTALITSTLLPAR